jgi:thiamine-phosphate pyrophosphorylase
MMSDPIPPRLYLLAPVALGATALSAALDGGDVASVLLLGATADSRPLVEAVQAHEAAALVADNPTLASRLGADGVHLGPGGDAAAARRGLGEDAIVGVTCGESRHDAMLAGEAGADYVAFCGRGDQPAAPADPAILGWWQAVMELPCVAFGEVALADVGDLARAGADFVALRDAVWRHPDGPAAAVAEANRQLDAAHDAR